MARVDPVVGARVETVAGTDAKDWVDGALSDARFRSLCGIHIGASGQIYVSDASLVRMCWNEFVTTEAGQGKSRLRDPCGLALDPRPDTEWRHLYVADCSSHCIRRCSFHLWANSFKIEIYAGTENKAGFQDGAVHDALFNRPRGLVCDAKGVLWVCDSGNNRIRKVTDSSVKTLAGTGTAKCADGPGFQAAFANPHGIAMDSSGNFVIADRDNHRIRKVTPDGVTSTWAGSGTNGYTDGLTQFNAMFNCPTDVAVDSVGNIYVADTGEVGTIGTLKPMRNTHSGEPIHMDGPCEVATFIYPSGVACDSDGHVYTVETSNPRIRKITIPAHVRAGKGLPKGEAAAKGGSTGAVRKMSDGRDFKSAAPVSSGAGGFRSECPDCSCRRYRRGVMSALCEYCHHSHKVASSLEGMGSGNGSSDSPSARSGAASPAAMMTSTPVSFSPSPATVAVTASSSSNFDMFDVFAAAAPASSSSGGPSFSSSSSSLVSSSASSSSTFDPFASPPAPITSIGVTTGFAPTSSASPFFPVTAAGTPPATRPPPAGAAATGKSSSVFSFEDAFDPFPPSRSASGAAAIPATAAGGSPFFPSGGPVGVSAGGGSVPPPGMARGSSGSPMYAGSAPASHGGSPIAIGGTIGGGVAPRSFPPAPLSMSPFDVVLTASHPSPTAGTGPAVGGRGGAAGASGSVPSQSPFDLFVSSAVSPASGAHHHHLPIMPGGGVAAGGAVRPQMSGVGSYAPAFGPMGGAVIGGGPGSAPTSTPASPHYGGMPAHISPTAHGGVPGYSPAHRNPYGGGGAPAAAYDPFSPHITSTAPASAGASFFPAGTPATSATQRATSAPVTVASTPASWTPF